VNHEIVYMPSLYLTNIFDDLTAINIAQELNLKEVVYVCARARVCVCICVFKTQKIKTKPKSNKPILYNDKLIIIKKTIYYIKNYNVKYEILPQISVNSMLQ